MFDDRCQGGFKSVLEQYSIEAAEQFNGSVYGLWPNFTLAYFNPGWIEFAKANGGDKDLWDPRVLGRSVMDVTPEELHPFYSRFFQRGCQGRADIDGPLQHRYECSSPHVFREFLMTLYPLGELEGVLVVNSVVVERDHDAVVHAPDFSAYEDRDGIIHQCAHCRKIQHVNTLNRWDWVPAWLERVPANTSHTLCRMCLEHYYPSQ